MLRWVAGSPSLIDMGEELLTGTPGMRTAVSAISACDPMASTSLRNGLERDASIPGVARGKQPYRMRRHHYLIGAIVCIKQAPRPREVFIDRAWREGDSPGDLLRAIAPFGKHDALAWPRIE
jgi:hypothetical protein